MTGLMVVPGFAPSDACARAVAAFDLAASPMATRREVGALRLGDSVARLRRDCWLTVCLLANTDPTHLWVDLSLLSAMPAGDRMSLHADNVRRLGGGAWGPNHTPWRRYTSLLYLAAAQGGDLHFPALEVRVSPRPGLFAAFPCGPEFEHQVLPVLADQRYALAMWYTDDPAHREAMA